MGCINPVRPSTIYKQSNFGGDGINKMSLFHIPGGQMHSDGASRTVRSLANPSSSFCPEGEGKHGCLENKCILTACTRRAKLQNKSPSAMCK